METRGSIRCLAQRGGLPLFLVWLSFPGLGADWAQYRGPNHNGTSAEHINKQWVGTVTNPVWRVPLPKCLGSFAISGGRAFTQTRRLASGAEREVCVALNITNGTELWATKIEDNTSLYDGGVGNDDGPRTTPATDGASVFVLSSWLTLSRLNATNGALIWDQDLKEVYGASIIGWQNAASPLLEDGLVFLNANTGTSTLMALHASDGSIAWRSQDEAMTHSTPVLATIQGSRHLVFATQDGLVSVDPQSGDLLWKFSYPFTYSISLAASPVVHRDIVFVTGFYDQGAAAVQIVLSNAVYVPLPLWTNLAFSSHWMTPVAHEGFLYGQFTPSFAQDLPNAAPLKCVDLLTGIEKWSVNNFGRGATLLVDDHLLIVTESGQLVLARPNTNAYTEVGRCLAITNYNRDNNKCWNAPAIADGRVYVRSTSYAVCFDFSLPALKLDKPLNNGADKLRLIVRAVNGVPLDSNRVAGLELCVGTNLSQAVTEWPTVTNRAVWTNGVAQIDNVDASPRPRRFFIVREPD